MLPNMHRELPWDILRDFEPVSLVATIEWGLVARHRRRSGARPTDRRGKGEAGRAQLRLRRQRQPAAHRDGTVCARGISLTHVPLRAPRGGADVAPGRSRVIPGVPTVFSLIQGGKLKLMGVASPGARRCFPTCRRSPKRAARTSSSLLVRVVAPAGTPKEIIARLNAEIVKALADPGVREKLVAQGFTVGGSTPEELGVATREQLAKYARTDSSRPTSRWTDRRIEHPGDRTSLSDHEASAARKSRMRSSRNRQTNGSRK